MATDQQEGDGVTARRMAQRRHAKLSPAFHVVRIFCDGHLLPHLTVPHGRVRLPIKNVAVQLVNETSCARSGTDLHHR